MITWEVNFAVKDMVENELLVKAKELSQEIIRTSLYNPQSGIQSGEYSVVEQVMLDQLCDSLMGETFHAHRVKLFDTGPASDRMYRIFVDRRLGDGARSDFLDMQNGFQSVKVEWKRHRTALAPKTLTYCRNLSRCHRITIDCLKFGSE